MHCPFRWHLTSVLNAIANADAAGLKAVYGWRIDWISARGQESFTVGPLRNAAPVEKTGKSGVKSVATLPQ
jgi:hypothetical protein